MSWLQNLFMGKKKVLEPEKDNLLRGLERRVGNLSRPNISAATEYVQLVENWKKEYDVSRYENKDTIYKDILKRIK